MQGQILSSLCMLLNSWFPVWQCAMLRCSAQVRLIDLHLRAADLTVDIGSPFDQAVSTLEAAQNSFINRRYEMALYSVIVLFFVTVKTPLSSLSRDVQIPGDCDVPICYLLSYVRTCHSRSSDYLRLRLDDPMVFQQHRALHPLAQRPIISRTHSCGI